MQCGTLPMGVCIPASFQVQLVVAAYGAGALPAFTGESKLEGSFSCQETGVNASLIFMAE